MNHWNTFTSADGGASGTLVGLSYVSNSDGDNTANTTDGISQWLMDAQMQFGGSNLYVSYADFSNDNTVGPANTDSDTLTVMYGMYLDTDWEVYGSWINSDGSAAGPLNGSLMSIGLNNYMAGQNAKWTTGTIALDGILAVELKFEFQLGIGFQIQVCTIIPS